MGKIRIHFGEPEKIEKPSAGCQIIIITIIILLITIIITYYCSGFESIEMRSITFLHFFIELYDLFHAEVRVYLLTLILTVIKETWPNYNIQPI